MLIRPDPDTSHCLEREGSLIRAITQEYHRQFNMTMQIWKSAIIKDETDLSTHRNPSPWPLWPAWCPARRLWARGPPYHRRGGPRPLPQSAHVSSGRTYLQPKIIGHVWYLMHMVTCLSNQHWFQCGSGSSRLPQCGKSGSREPNLCGSGSGSRSDFAVTKRWILTWKTYPT